MTMYGIDVSGWQPDTIVEQVAGSIDFVIVKATEGTGYVSGACDPQVQDAIRLEKLWGFYHFASPGDATAQADYFVDNTKNYFRHGVPVLDFEAQAAGMYGGAWVREFCDRVFASTCQPLSLIHI